MALLFRGRPWHFYLQAGYLDNSNELETVLMLQHHKLEIGK